MSDVKFSQFVNGGGLQTGNEIVGLEGGVNKRFPIVNPSNNYYFSINGDDSIGSGSITYPFKTIFKTVSVTGTEGNQSSLAFFPGAYDQDTSGNAGQMPLNPWINFVGESIPDATVINLQDGSDGSGTFINNPLLWTSAGGNIGYKNLTFRAAFDLEFTISNSDLITVNYDNVIFNRPVSITSSSVDPDSTIVNFNKILSIPNPLDAGSSVSSINAIEEGSGYTFANVSFVGGGGYGTTATALIGFGVDSITLNNGGTYTATPDINLTVGTGATFQCHMGAYAVSSIANTGFFYNGGDSITLAGGTGSPTILNVQYTEIYQFGLDNPGSGYAVNDEIKVGSNGTEVILPIIVVDAVGAGGELSAWHFINTGRFTTNGTAFFQDTTDGGGSGATWTADGGDYILQAVTIVDPGDYTVIPSNPVSQASSSGSGVSAQFNLNINIQSVETLTAGQDYDNTSVATVTGGAGSGGDVTAVLETTGGVKGYTVDDGGEFYFESPNVIVVGDGSGATAEAFLSSAPSLGLSGDGLTFNIFNYYSGGGLQFSANEATDSVLNMSNSTWNKLVNLSANSTQILTATITNTNFLDGLNIDGTNVSVLMDIFSFTSGNISYTNGATSSQITVNSIGAGATEVITITGSTVLNATHWNNRLRFNSASPMTITFPEQSTLPTVAGTNFSYENVGAGDVTFAKQGIEGLIGNTLCATNASGFVMRDTTTDWFVTGGTSVLTNTISFNVQTVGNVTYSIAKLPGSGTFTNLYSICRSGTCTATWAISGTPITVTPNSVSTTEQSQTPTALNNYTNGQYLQATISANTLCLDMNLNAVYTYRMNI